MSGLKPMTSKNEGGAKPLASGVKLSTSIKTATVEQMNTNFITWDDLKDGQSIVFELTGEFRTTVSPKNKTHKFTNYYTPKVVVVDAQDNVVKVVADADSFIQVPCQASHRQGIQDLLDMDENVAIYKDMKPNTKDGNTYYNCNIGSLEIEDLSAFE